MIKIPPSLKIKNKTVYEVVRLDSFVDNPEVLGECRFDIKQIVIRTGLSKPQEVKTFLHECLHAICHERGINLSHKSIYELEDALYYILTRNKFEKEK